MTEDERRESERLYREWRDKYDASFIGRWSEHKVPLNPDIFAAGRESMRTERAELGSGWRAYEVERARSTKLLKMLMDALPAVITLESQNGRRLWTMSDRIKKEIDEYEAARE